MNDTGIVAQEVGHLIPNAVLLSTDKPAENNIIFHTGSTNSSKELLRISLEGITAPSDVPIDEAAKLILATLSEAIQAMVHRAWVMLDEDELRNCYSIALQYDVDLATVIQNAFIEKNRKRLGEEVNAKS